MWYGWWDGIPAVGDFNGDGMDDIAIFDRGGWGTVRVALSIGFLFLSESWPWHEQFSYPGEIPAVGDFNGDGMDDIAAFTRGSRGDVYVALSNGYRFEGTGWLWHDFFSIYDEIPVVGDLNGDGMDDVATFLRGNEGRVAAALSNGEGFVGTGWQWADGICLQQDICALGDVTGDGRADAIGFKR